MNIILIGFRGSGKTTVGKTLARALGMRFVSTDEIVENRAGRPIAEIVQKHGWEKFRQLERQAVKEVSRLDERVVDTGGGVVLNPANVKDLRRCGKIVWLKANLRVTKARIKKGGSKRPPLTGKTTVLQETPRVMAQRRAKYAAAADLVIDTSRLSRSEVVKRIIRAVG